jgi:putative ABC transport system ATP-binding protein
MAQGDRFAAVAAVSAPDSTSITPPASLRSAPVIEARALHRFYRTGAQETLALRGVSLSVDRGELVAVLGPSGSGKSTLVACLAGLDEPDGGTVEIAGRAMSHQSEQVRTRIRAAAIGMVFQSANLIEHLTVVQNVALVQSLAAAWRRADRVALLDSLGLAHRADAYPSRLSGGEASRAALAVALANQPAVLLADEPTGELDSSAEAEVLTLLRDAAGRGSAVLVASHSPAVAEAADRCITLVDGQVQP